LGGGRASAEPGRSAPDGRDVARRLRTDRIDVFLFHSLTFEGDIEAVRYGPLWPELERLKRRTIGFVRAVQLV
jgi:hypothetical protein